MNILSKESPQGYDFKRLYQRSIGKPTPILSNWGELMCFRPSVDIQQGLRNRGVKIHKIEDAVSANISLDYYPVRIEKFPDLGSGILTAEQLLSKIRFSINDFLNPWLAEFRPFEPSIDSPKWDSSKLRDHLGTVLLIAITGEPGGAAVVVGNSTIDNIIFTTVYTRESFNHPVSGHRQIGYISTGEAGVYEFFAKGTDALTGLLDIGRFIYPAQDVLWRGFQERLSSFVNDNGGVAKIIKPIIHRPPLLETMRDYCVNPKVPWIE